MLSSQSVKTQLKPETCFTVSLSFQLSPEEGTVITFKTLTSLHKEKQKNSKDV